MDPKYLSALLQELTRIKYRTSTGSTGNPHDPIEDQEDERAQLLREDIGAALEDVLPDFGEGFAADTEEDHPEDAASPSQEGQEGASEDFPDPVPLRGLASPLRTFGGRDAGDVHPEAWE